MYELEKQFVGLKMGLRTGFYFRYVLVFAFDPNTPLTTCLTLKRVLVFCYIFSFLSL